MAKVIYVPPADPVAPKRDINFTTEKEAMLVAGTFADDKQITTDIRVIALAPEAANTHPEDGRLWHQIQFTRTMTVTNDLGRSQEQSIPFDLNAGICLDDAANNPLEPWEYTQSGTDGNRVGDVERSDGK